MDDSASCNGGSVADVGCQPAKCGDGHANALAGEVCDRGEADTPGCNGKDAGNASCKRSSCGDGHVNRAASEECETDADCTGGRKCNSCHCG